MNVYGSLPQGGRHVWIWPNYLVSKSTVNKLSMLFLLSARVLILDQILGWINGQTDRQPKLDVARGFGGLRPKISKFLHGNIHPALMSAQQTLKCV